MKTIQRLKYMFVYTIPLTVLFAFNLEGYWTFITLVVFFGLVPLLELLLPPDRANFDKKIADDEKNQKVYDYILYATLPIQIGFLIYFFYIIGETPYGTMEYIGRITAMGFMCGVVGINVGHELGHRHTRWEQLMGEILLLTSLNTHFLPYHNAGHHRNVATPEDSATARKNELLFVYWFRSHFGSYIEAWRLENQRLRASSRHWFSLQNRMVVYSIANIALLVLIYSLFGTKVLIAFLGAAAFGILLLETVNYIEHYGLLRKKNEQGRYAPVRHNHSWNSDHPIGRTLLFNLSRHSDHHYNGSKKYQVLKSHEKSPQMPTGYPGMMLLAVMQPLWFWVMNKKLKEFR
ncbi:alkane 1-monooxygenase [Croceitalea dokdonensis DOKDO 023]|uniref:Alkane 1-monooxygenase n=1 Tax=Croceitalea dokdonensis DOKDO 023 TaxID=1300341 RepID=A0A0N8H434_9FLAO|nr:alkane 1-monooxygenase [Croceitalea dokdonensis]KPM32260.1 alkane 1-monooxygenase [Croceitalea dokdonensis DOKDO 023]